jgi:hypothetical protein
MRKNSILRLCLAVPFAALSAVPADAADHQVNDLTEISLSLGSFTRGSLDGERATLLIAETRAVPDSGSLADRSAVTNEIYSLQRATEPVGETADVFKRVLVRLSAKQYCNSDMALSKEFGLPLPNDYRGPSTADGCLN